MTRQGLVLVLPETFTVGMATGCGFVILGFVRGYSGDDDRSRRRGAAM